MNCMHATVQVKGNEVELYIIVISPVWYFINYKKSLYIYSGEAQFMASSRPSAYYSYI